MSSKELKLYSERDIEAQGQVYCDHVRAMTVEGLHAKSDIAAELAHRDIEIERLRAAVWKYGKHLTACRLQKDLSSWCDCGWAKRRETLAPRSTR